MKVWIACTVDEYQTIEAMEDTAPALAKTLGIKVNTIYSAISHSRSRGNRCRYECVEIGDIYATEQSDQN